MEIPVTRNLRMKNKSRSAAANLSPMSCFRACAPYFFAGVVALLLQVPPAHAEASPAETFVQQSVEKGFAILKDTNIPPQEREMQFRALMRSIFDFKRVGVFALGPYAKGASDKQIDDFVNAFADYFMTMFHFDSEQNPVGQGIMVTGATARGSDDVIVTAKVAGADAGSAAGMPMDLAFRVRKNAAGNDTIVDVLVGGISMAVTERDAFLSYLQQHSGNIEQLSAELEKRVASR
jgi:phospholipid transport system substrate-binding protein